MARIDIDPKYCISSEKKLALHIKMTKGWMELALKRPSRIDIANCAAHVEEHLLRTYGLIIEKNEDKMARITATKLLEQWVKEAKPIWSGTEWRPNCGGQHTCPFCGSGSGWAYQITFPMDELAHAKDCFYIESKRFLEKVKERKDKRRNIK